YAPAGWATLYGYLVEQKHYPVQLVEQAGLIAPRKSGTGYYDRFRDRLMIPIRDPQGRVIGFGGRTLSGDEPKYLNSPETELFDKGNTLFGLDQARSAIAKFDRAVVVEGYFDVIALQAAGITNVVAALGTALGVAQVKQLLKYTESKQIIFNFDADRAGQQATERAIGAVADLAYQGQVQLRVLNLPGGKDADEYLQRASAADYRHLLDTAPLWLDWQIQQVLTQANLQEADQFQTAIQAIVQLLGKLPNAPLRTHYIHRCAELLGQGESRVTVQLEEDLRLQVRGQRWHGRSQKWERPGDAGVRELAEAQLLRIYLHVPALRDDLRSLLRERDLSFSFMPHRLLWRSILVLAEAQGGRKTDTTSDLVVQLQDAITDFPPKAANRIMAILELNEKTELDILRPQLGLRQAAATLERLESEKRCRHLLDSWQAQKVQSIERCVQQLLAQDQGTVTDLETQLQQLYQNLNTEALQFQKLFYDERQYQQTLDHQRCTSQAELVQVS
ncbi:MAG: toprim domain-containing protein, partial [Cyanobacteria bacterium P01_H01_bin.121]